MNAFKIRITSGYEFPLIVEGASKYQVCLENPDTNIHLHYTLYTHETSDTIRKKCKKHPEFTPGNKFYSVKVLKPLIEEGFEEYPNIRYEAYCTKQGRHRYHNYDDTHINKISEYWKIYNDEMKDRRETLKKAPKQLDIIRDTYFANAKLMSDNKTYVNTETGTTYTLEDIVDIVHRYYTENDKLIQEFRMISQITTLANKYVPSYDYQFKNYLLMKCNYKII